MWASDDLALDQTRESFLVDSGAFGGSPDGGGGTVTVIEAPAVEAPSSFVDVAPTVDAAPASDPAILPVTETTVEPMDAAYSAPVVSDTTMTANGRAVVMWAPGMSYDPAIDAANGYFVDAGSWGSFTQAKDDYSIAQLRAAGATQIQWDPFKNMWVDAAVTPIYNAAGTGPVGGMSVEDSAANALRVAEILADPNTSADVRALVSDPNYQTLGDKSGDATITGLLTKIQAAFVPADPISGYDALVNGKHYDNAADAIAAQQDVPVSAGADSGNSTRAVVDKLTLQPAPAAGASGGVSSGGVVPSAPNGPNGLLIAAALAGALFLASKL